MVIGLLVVVEEIMMAQLVYPSAVYLPVTIIKLYSKTSTKLSE